MSSEFLTFDEGIQRIEAALKSSKFDFKARITTSHDRAAVAATDALLIVNPPDGFKKFQLPLYFDGPTQMFVSVGAPDTEVPEHSHDEGDGIRYIASGSIIYQNQTLTEGDWMFIPKGHPYSFKVGPRGVTAFYCYQCCCAPRESR